MIITVADESGGTGKSILAGRLAASRALAGRKVLLLDADPRRGAPQERFGDAGPRPVARAISAKGLQPELEHLVNCYHDIVIDSEGRDSMGSRSALIAAGVVVVPYGPDRGDAGAADTRLVARIAKARMFNPGLRVLVVPVGERGAASDDERRCAGAFAARILAAALTDIEHLYGAAFQ